MSTEIAVSAPGISVIAVDPGVSTEAKVLDAAFDELNEHGTIVLSSLFRRLKWSKRKWSEVRTAYYKWSMSTWENGDEQHEES